MTTFHGPGRGGKAIGEGPGGIGGDGQGVGPLPADRRWQRGRRRRVDRHRPVVGSPGLHPRGPDLGCHHRDASRYRVGLGRRCGRPRCGCVVLRRSQLSSGPGRLGSGRGRLGSCRHSAGSGRTRLGAGPGPVGHGRITLVRNRVHSGRQLGDLAGGGATGPPLLGEGSGGTGRLGSRRGGYLLGPAGHPLGCAQSPAGIVLGPVVRHTGPGVVSPRRHGVELGLPAVGAGEEEPTGSAHRLLRHLVDHLGPKRLVGVERPAGRHQRPGRELGEVQEGPKADRSGSGGKVLLAGPGHGHRRLQRRAQEGVGGRGQLPDCSAGAPSRRSEGRSGPSVRSEGRSGPGSPVAGAASGSTARPEPHHRHDTTSTTSLSTSGSSTDRSPLSE